MLGNIGEINGNNKRTNWLIGTKGSLGPGVHYLPVYWACGPSQEQGSTRGGEFFIKGDCVDE